MSAKHLIGIDEAGRGPWTLTPAKREALAGLIRAQALGWAVGSASADEVDQLNILQATFLAMRRAVAALPDRLLNDCHAWVDGNRDPLLGLPTTTIVKGDALMPAISAASILAKVARDAESHAMHLRYPDYGFDAHKGYGTAVHIANLAKYGALPEHRRSFAPVARWFAAHPQ
jgi:ribonuclease HII